MNATIYSTINEQLSFSAIPLMDPQPFYGVREITIKTDDTLKRPITQIPGQNTGTIKPPTIIQNTDPQSPITQNTNPNPSPQNPTNQNSQTTPTNKNSQSKLEGEERVEKIFFANEKNTPQNKTPPTTLGIVERFIH